MGVAERLRQHIFRTTTPTFRDCDDELPASGIYAVMRFKNNSGACDFYPNQRYDQTVGVTARKLGKGMHIHLKAAPKQGLKVIGNQWEADISVNIQGNRNPTRDFELKRDSAYDGNDGILVIEVWKTHNAVGSSIPYADIPSMSYSTHIGDMKAEYTLP